MSRCAMLAPRRLAITAALGLTVGLGGCGGPESLVHDLGGAANLEPAGWVYSLPRSTFTITINDVSAGAADTDEYRPLTLSTVITGPHFVADPHYTYNLVFDEAPTNSESIGVYYFPGTPFLREIVFRSESEIDESLVAAVTDWKALGEPDRDAVSTGTTIAGPITADLLTPSGRRSAETVLESAIETYFRLVADDRRCSDEQGRVATRCVEARRALEALTAADGDFVAISLSEVGAAGAPFDVNDVPRSPADCGEGVCYRPLRPFVLSLRVGPPEGDALWRSEVIVMLPDASQVASLALERPLLAQRGTRIVFEYPSVPAAIVAGRESETTEAILLPFELAGAALGVTIQPVTGAGAAANLNDALAGPAGTLPNYTTQGPVPYEAAQGNEAASLSVRYPIYPVTPPPAED